MQTMRVAVMKFGGTSVATREARETAFARIFAAREAGFAPVAVVSAMGRAPQPYATDTLLGLIGGNTGSANSDLLLACGELISAAVFAEELRAMNVEAQAMTGAQAGIRTDGTHGDAKILEVVPDAMLAAIERGIVPIVAGFQGLSPEGAITTLGRGGSDLSAIALGHALAADRVDIYTDVSGAMTADPRRVSSAHVIARASHEEMTELAERGAKVMHHKAAAYAEHTGTTYAIKGLTTDVGTTVAAGYASERPVTGVTASGRVTWVRVIRGDIENPTQRMQTELEMFRRIADADISIDQVTINQAGVAFVVEGDRGRDVRTLLADLNLAVRVREGCAKISVVGHGMRYMPGVVFQCVAALSRANVEIIHCTDSNITISILVPEADVVRAEAAVHDQFHLEAGEA
ncbi:MAG: aspartate kinase [bacterium]|nr:aspartate kinase [bacterium]